MGRIHWSSTTTTRKDERAFHTRTFHKHGLGVVSLAWELLHSDSVLVRIIEGENTVRAITDFLPR